MVGGISFTGATVSAVHACREPDATDNVFSQIGIRIVSADGATVRATLLAVGEYGNAVEIHAAASGRASSVVASGTALASYTTQPGDRLVVEIGWVDASGTTPQAIGVYGSSAATDYALADGDTTLRNPWVEFSNDIQWLDGSGVTDVADRGPDTLFFGYSADGTVADLDDDLSGNATDWSSAGACIYVEDHDAAVTSSWAIEMAFTLDSTDSGYVFAHNAGDLAVLADGAGGLDIVFGGSTETTITVPSTSATASLVFLQWSLEPNPLTTGAGDAQLHTIRVYNADSGEWEGYSWTETAHAYFAGLTGDTVFGDVDITGVNTPYTGGLRMLRFSTHHHTPDELVACFLDVSAAPSLHGVSRREWPMPNVASGIGNDGMLAGPVYAMACKHVRSQDLRLHGPLVNEICTGAWAEDSTWTTTDPENPTYTMHLEFLRRRPVPPGCNRVLFRVFVQQNDAVADRLYTRAYVGDAPGYQSKPAPSPATPTIVSDFVQRSADDGTGDTGGAWIEIGPLYITPDADGYIYVWLGFLSSVPDYRVKAWSVEPLLDTSTDVLGGGAIGGLGG